MSGDSRTLTANFVADTSGFSPKINELIQRLKALNQDFETNKAKVKDLNNQIKEYEKELKQLNSVTGNGATASREQQQRMQQLRDSIAACNTQIGTYRAAQTNLRSQINSTNRELTEQQQAFNGVNTAAMSFGEILKANLASSAIQAGLRQTLDLLRQAAAYCYQVGSSFESGMSQVAAVSGASADELEKLTARAKELGASSKFSATEVSQAMNYMAMAGWKTQEMLDGIDGVLGLAAASGTDLATTSDIVTDALTAFGMKASDCAHFADVLAAASSNANTNVSMMGETFKYCAPVAGALGFKAEEVAVGIGLMANAGVKATNAGTAMRKFMTELSEGLTITGEKIGKVTISTTNADGSMRSYAEILRELRDVFAQLTDSEKSTAARNIVGQNALSGFLAMMNASESDVNKLTEAIKNCDGAAASMAETMQDNVQGAVTKFNSALEGVGIAVYDKFKDGLTDAVNIFTECMANMESNIDNGTLSESMESLADSFRSAAREIAVIVKEDLPGFVKGLTNVLDFVITFRKEIASAAAGIAAFKTTMSIGNLVKNLITSFKSLSVALKGAQAAQTGLNAAMEANPVGAVAAAVSLLVAGIVELSAHANDAAEKMDRLRIESDEAAESVRRYEEKSKSLQDVKKRYDEIYNSVKTDAEKTDELQQLQDTLISQFPELKNQIDLVTGSYNDMADAIRRNNDELIENAKSEANVEYNKQQKLKEAEEKIVYSDYSHNKNLQIPFVKRDTYTDRSQVLQDKRVEEIFNTLSKEYENLSLNYVKTPGYYTDYSISISGDSSEKSEIFDALRKAFENAGLANERGAISDYYDWLAASAKEYSKKADDYRNAEDDWNRLVNGIVPKPERVPDFAGAWAMAEQNDYRDDGYNDVEEKKPTEPGLTKEEREKQYKEDKQLADDMYSVGEISAEEYYKKLVALRDNYLEKGTHEWYVATAQIQNAYAKTADGIAEAAAKSASKVKNSLDEVSMAYKKTLAAIDAEIERRNREKSDLEFQAKIDEIDSQLAYGRLDDFSKYELEKERQRLIDEHEDELYERSATDAKSIVKDVYEAKTTLDKADWGTREYTLALGDYTDTLGDLTNVMRNVGVAMGVQNSGNSSVSNIDESTKNNYVNVILQAVNKSNSQLIDELLRALHSGL